MDVSNELIAQFQQLAIKQVMNCEKHGNNVEALMNGGCRLCRDADVAAQEEANRLKKFRELQYKAFLPVDCIYLNASFMNYTPSCIFAAEIKSRLISYQFDKNILFTGTTGIGKTHLSMALLNKALDMGKTGFYIQFYKLAMLKIQQKDKYEYMLSCDCLILDEFGVNETDYKGGVLYEIIDERAFRGKYTILLSNYDSKVLKSKLPDAIYSRLQENCMAFLDCKWEDYRKKGGA